MIVLRLVFLAQLLVMLSGWTILVATPVDFHTLALMFYLVIIAAVVLVYALWQAIRHPARRRWAVATAATPLLCLTTPFFLVWLNGGPIHPAVLVGLVIVSGVVACFILLARSEQWRDDALARKWVKLRQLRRVVTGALEVKRADKTLGSSLQARVVISADPAYRQAAENIDLAELCLTSQAAFADGPAAADAFTLADIPGASVVVERATGAKCERCWQILPDVGQTAAYPDLCYRCADAVDRYLTAAE